jgi:predicted nucleic acid-binding protein
VAAAFASAQEMVEAMQGLTVAFSPMEAGTAQAAGAAFQRYRRRGGVRERMVADFLIGAHALSQADRLLTRDRGFYRSYFKELAILDPSAAKT